MAAPLGSSPPVEMTGDPTIICCNRGTVIAKRGPRSEVTITTYTICGGDSSWLTSLFNCCCCKSKSAADPTALQRHDVVPLPAGAAAYAPTLPTGASSGGRPPPVLVATASGHGGHTLSPATCSPQALDLLQAIIPVLQKARDTMSELEQNAVNDWLACVKFFVIQEQGSHVSMEASPAGKVIQDRVDEYRRQKLRQDIEALVLEERSHASTDPVYATPDQINSIVQRIETDLNAGDITLGKTEIRQAVIQHLKDLNYRIAQPPAFDVISQKYSHGRISPDDVPYIMEQVMRYRSSESPPREGEGVAGAGLSARGPQRWAAKRNLDSSPRAHLEAPSATTEAIATASAVGGTGGGRTYSAGGHVVDITGSTGGGDRTRSAGGVGDLRCSSEGGAAPSPKPPK